jgi:hypothetical protein
MSEYRVRTSVNSIGESVDVIQRLMLDCGAQISGAMLSTVSFAAGEETVIVAARLTFSETEIAPREEHRYPAFVLRDKWVSCDEALQLLRDAPNGSDSLPPCKKISCPSSIERVLTMYGEYEALQQPSVLASYYLSDQRTPENLPVVAFGLPPFPSWDTAAIWWFGQNGDNLKGKHHLTAVLPDYRATIESAELVRGELCVKVSVRESIASWELHYVLGEDRRPVVRNYVPVSSNEVVIGTEQRFRKAELWLISKGSSLPAAHRTFWSLRDEHVALDADEIEAHRVRILNGESDTVELKPFLEDSKKTTEVAESVTSFANTRGGFLYIGVQDDCVLQGQAKLEGVHKGDKRQARDGQTRKVREVIGRIDPVPIYSLIWIELKSGPVLVVEAPKSNDIHTLDTTRVLVRSGSSDRSATRSELHQLFRDRGGVVRGHPFEDEY